MPGDLTDLVAWQEAASLAADLVNRLKKPFPGPGGQRAAEQIVTAAESISANIAEGYGRGFGADGVRFLRYARGSASELEDHITVCMLGGRFEKAEGEAYVRRIRRVRALVNGLMKYYGRDDEAA